MGRGTWRRLTMIVLLATALPPATLALGAGPMPPAPAALVRVDSGTSVTIWERTTAQNTQNMYTFDVPTLAIVGLWSARRRPWKPPVRAGAAKAFALLSLPFVGAELATGVASGLLGVLTIPPVFGLGLAVDLAILLSGIVTAIAWAVRKVPSPHPS